MSRVFLGRKVVRLRSSRVSLLGLQGPTTHPDEVNIPNSDDADDCPGQGQDALSANVRQCFDDLCLQEQIAALRSQLVDCEARVAKLQEENAALHEALEEAERDAKRFRFHDVSQDEKVFHFYTGVSLGTFTDVAKIVGDSLEGGGNRGRPKGRSTLTREDELFMVLCKLRHDFPESDLASRFNVSQPTISRIFREWVFVSRIHSKNWTFGLARSLFKRVYLMHSRTTGLHGS